MQIEIELAPKPVPHPAVAAWLQAAEEAERAGLNFAASTYRSTARSIVLEQDTGVAVCACCFKPFSRGALHH